MMAVEVRIVAVVFPGKGFEGVFHSTGNIVYLDLDIGYEDVYMCKNLLSYTFKIWTLSGFCTLIKILI